jgi:hypothetical protein
LNQVGSGSTLNGEDSTITLPADMHVGNNIRSLIDEVYPGLDNFSVSTDDYFRERTILSARNDDVNVINAEALNIFPGVQKTYFSADKAVLEDGADNNNVYPTEFLNSLDPSGLPPYKLELKPGCPIMLLRNLAPRDGLCNGSRLRVVRFSERVIEARILTGDHSGRLVFIPRISLSPSTGELPFSFTRRQFPIRLAFSMTINKSQGQPVKYVGIDLRTPVFSHGQLYVSL